MPVEVAKLVDDFNKLWPRGTDPVSKADDHIRMIKEVLQLEFELLYNKTRVFSFEAGAVVNPDCILYCEAEKTFYQWNGAYDVNNKYIVPAGSTPATAGGIGANAWARSTGSGFMSTVLVSDTEPTAPFQNMLWWDTNSGIFFIYYNDGTSTQWVDLFGIADQASFNTLLFRFVFARLAAESGYNLVAGSFEEGGTLTNTNDVLWYQSNGRYYSWNGALPKVVAAGTNPTAVTGYVSRNDVTLRGELSGAGGADMVGTDDGRSVQDRLSTILVDAAGTAAMLVNQHNNDPMAHTQLSAFITAEADRAEQAADAASLSGDIYPDTASGLASTTNGRYFSVVSPSADGYLDLYRNNSGAAAYQKTYPSSALVKMLDDGFNKLTGDNGFSMDGSDGKSSIEVATGDRKALIIGDHSTEMMTFDTVEKKVIHAKSDLTDTTITRIMRTSDNEEAESEYTEDLISSRYAKVIGDGKRALTFDTVAGELISTFKIVDNSQNNYTVFDNDIPSVVTGIPPEYAKANRLYQAIPTIVKTGDRFWLSWRADVITAGEGCGNFFVIGYSDDNCQTVTETHVIRFYNLDHQLIDTMLWVNPETGEVWIFWSSSSKALQMDGMLGCWCSVLENPNAATGFSWSTPTRFHNVGHPRRPVRINGAWVQCIDNFAHDARYLPIYPETTGCTFFNFDPRTKSVTRIGRNSPNYINGKYTGFFETEVVQLIDGRLLSTTRGPSGSELTRSFSSDGGKTWTAQEEYTALYPVSSSRCWLGRTPHGRLIMAYNNDLVRKTLTVKLSDDEGETWPYSVILEPFDTPNTCSYPVVAFDGDKIYVAYDVGRGVANEIRVAMVKESEIVAGTSIPATSIVSGPGI